MTESIEPGIFAIVVVRYFIGWLFKRPKRCIASGQTFICNMRAQYPSKYVSDASSAKMRLFVCRQSWQVEVGGLRPAAFQAPSTEHVRPMIDKWTFVNSATAGTLREQRMTSQILDPEVVPNGDDSQGRSSSGARLNGFTEECGVDETMDG
jgi:hypothetical protein